MAIAQATFEFGADRPGFAASDEEIARQVAGVDDLLDLGGEPQPQRALDRCLFAGGEAIDDQRDQRHGHHRPHRRHGVAVDAAVRIECRSHPRLQCAQRVRAGEIGAAGGDQAAHLRPAHALMAAEQVGQGFNNEQLLGILLVYPASPFGTEHPDAAGLQFQHRALAFHPGRQAFGGDAALLFHHPFHARVSGKKGLEDESLRLATVQTRRKAGESELDPERPGIPHTAFFVRMNIEADAQCSGESFHFHSLDCCVVCQDYPDRRLIPQVYGAV
ncbi:hypothetical protein D3C71_1101700 [compost metagenome]